MATLVIQEAYHFNDSHILTITTSLVDLVIAEAYHYHWSDAIGDMRQNTLSIPDGDIDHVANGAIALSERKYLSIAEAYHLHVVDAARASMSFHLGTSEFYQINLPVLKLTAHGDHGILSLEGGLRLPVPILSSRSGARCGDGVLSDLGLSATGTSDHLGQVANRRLSTLILSARGGIRCGAIKLPVPELTISVIGDLIGRLSRHLPPIGLSATGSTPVIGDMGRYLPTLIFDAAMSWTGSGGLAGTLPGLKLTSAISLKQYGTLSKSISSITVDDMTGHRSSIDVDVDLPTIVMTGIGSGSFGIDAGGGYAYDAERFDDYVLRYSR